MPFFINLDLLTDVPETVLQQLESIAARLWETDHIKLKIIQAYGNKVKVRVSQVAHPGGKYYTAKQLIQLIHDEMDPLLPDKKILIGPLPYHTTPAHKVSPQWINQQMLITGTGIDTIAADSGISREQLKQYLNQEVSLDNLARAFFFYYFLNKYGEE